jgi:hypothetical protein
MNFTALGIPVRSKRDAGTFVEYAFVFPENSESLILQGLLESMQKNDELSVVDPENLECSFDVRLAQSSFEMKHGCHGAHGTWQACIIEEAHAWLLPGALCASRVCRPGYGATYFERK